jgi:hypothetical protein
VSSHHRLDDRAIVLETIESMSKMSQLTPEMRSQLEELRDRVESFRSAAEQGDDG